jgi:hypothetical protein
LTSTTARAVAIKAIWATTAAKDAALARAAGSGPTRVFWIGGDLAKNAATDWAMTTGGETIGMTAEGRAVDALTTGMSWSKARPLSVAASERFAAGASGDVHVFQNAAGISVRSIWAETEYRTLVRNPNVANIIYHVVGGY